MRADYSGKVAVAGLGTTAQGEHPGRSAESLGIEALKLALDDAGIDKSRIDGLITCKTTQGQGADTSYGPLLGIDPAFSASLDYGSCNFSLHLAVMAIMTGMASTVALIYGCNQRTGKANFTGAYSAAANLTQPYGYLHMAGPFAMGFRRHQHLYGTTEEQLGHVAVVQREYARMNPLAVMTDPMTIEDYLASPYLIAPFRRQDFTMISDGGAALIVTTTERARDMAKAPVTVLGMAEQAAWHANDIENNVLRPWMTSVADRLYASADLSPADMDCLYVQDPFSFNVIAMLEQFGFCAPGEGGPFVVSGQTRLNGMLPTNTNGGQLSEAYMWGWLHLCEAVRQLRGECGARQVKGARLAQYVSSAATIRGAATILGAGV
jgi:acetyl-CoA acetyltransferase